MSLFGRELSEMQSQLVVHTGVSVEDTARAALRLGEQAAKNIERLDPDDEAGRQVELGALAEALLAIGICRDVSVAGEVARQAYLRSLGD